MVRLVTGGVAEFNALAYQERHPSTLEFLANQFSNVRHQFTDAGQQFFNQARDMYESVNSSAAMRRARALARSVKNAFMRDEIRELWSVEELQQASLRMQRFIMAEPTLRERYHKQRCDGYSDTYLDLYPGEVGEQHYDYRRVMNGVVQELPAQKDDPEGEDGWMVSIYFDDLVEGDRELEVAEQADILSTWDAIKARLAIDEDDPTSAYGAQL